jgi:16S rRNA (cytosine1402-N4)-methyltransferase
VLAEQISLPRDAVMVDATIGHGGHSWLFGQSFDSKAILIGLDLDENCLIRSAEKLKDLTCRVILLHSNFSEISRQVREQGIEKVDFILADLGVCSSQLVDEEIGLSFLHDMPLDMRIDKRIKRSAADIINRSDEKSLADLIFKYGQDRASRRIARFIVGQREKGPIKTTGQLAAIVSRALSTGKKGKRYTRIHPATRTFQALRIAVNNELENLEQLLCDAAGLLRKDGFIAIISFHSLEDRIVKYDFKQKEKDGLYKIITKKPIVPTKEEAAENRRSRSAKLRIAQRL